jgi:hypothetical protein
MSPVIWVTRKRTCHSVWSAVGFDGGRGRGTRGNHPISRAKAGGLRCLWRLARGYAAPDRRDAATRANLRRLLDGVLGTAACWRTDIPTGRSRPGTKRTTPQRPRSHRRYLEVISPIGIFWSFGQSPSPLPPYLAESTRAQSIAGCVPLIGNLRRCRASSGGKGPQ